MADTKITALTALTAADPANDVIPIVDVSDTTMAASGTTKKISVNNILGASGTATLASATITGAATVGTTLGVTGVSTFAAGTAALPALTTTGDTNTGIYYPAADTFAVTTGGTERLRVNSIGNAGLGVTPSSWYTSYGTKAFQFAASGVLYGLDVSSGDRRVGLLNNDFINTSGNDTYINTGHATKYQQTVGEHQWNTAASGTAGNAITFTQAMTLDASGNLLVGTVTSPSGTKIGSIAKLGKVSVEGSNSITVTTAATPLARAFDTGGLFFVSGYNNVGGSRGWFLVAAGGITPTVIASDNLTGLTVAFTSPSGVLNMNTTSGSLTVTSISLTNQGV